MRRFLDMADDENFGAGLMDEDGEDDEDEDEEDDEDGEGNENEV